MKKTAKPVRPGQGQPGGPPNPSSFKISSGLTVLGRKQTGVPSQPREPISNKTLNELKKMLAKIDAEKAKAKADTKKNAKIIKKQNKPKVVRGGSSKPKPVIKVKPRPRGGGMRGGMIGGGGDMFGQIK
jgi:hypothetical protein